MLQAGTVVDGQFEVVCSIGSGAQATVYRAVDLHLQRTVALKLMHLNAMQNVESEQRFQREARLISLMLHPNILRCYKFSRWEGSFYTCVDFFDGTSLATVLRDGPMPWRRALRICAEVANGMQHAHAQGVVHRDLTPSNIMISKGSVDHEQVKIVDFGLGKWLGNDASYQKLTQAGDIIGSIYCMSPEQCSGNEADGRSDVYSLGCILYFCLTGEAPFAALDALVMMQKHLAEEARSPSELARSGCPVQVDKVVAKALAKSPDDRYQTMAEFASDLEAVLEGKGLSAATNSFTSAHRPRLTNHVLVVCGIAAGIFLLSAALFKTQIVCSLLPLSNPVTACWVAAQLVSDRAPLSQTDRTDIAMHGARIAEQSNVCTPEAVMLYSRSDRGRPSSDGDTSHGSLMALKTLLALSHSPHAMPPNKLNRLASLTLAAIPSNCRNQGVCELCFAIVPKLDESLRAKYVKKGLDIFDTTQDQSKVVRLAKLFKYCSDLDRPDLNALKAPVVERCLRTMASIPPNHIAYGVSSLKTASQLPAKDPRRLSLLMDCSRSIEGISSAVDRQEMEYMLGESFIAIERYPEAVRALNRAATAGGGSAHLIQGRISYAMGQAYWKMEDYEKARICFLNVLHDASLPANEISGCVAHLALVTALISGPASGIDVLKHFHHDPARTAEELVVHVPEMITKDHAKRLVLAEMLIALPVKTRRQVTIHVDASIHRAICLEENKQQGQAELEYRRTLQYLKADQMLTPEEKASRIARATILLTKLVITSKASAKEAVVLLDSIEDIPPSLKDYCIWRDMLRSELMRQNGRFTECHAFLDTLIRRYPATSDVACIKREMGHLNALEGRFDEAITDYNESFRLFAMMANSSPTGSFEAELNYTRKSLEGVEAKKKLAATDRKKNPESP